MDTVCENSVRIVDLEAGTPGASVPNNNLYSNNGSNIKESFPHNGSRKRRKAFLDEKTFFQKVSLPFICHCVSVL